MTTTYPAEQILEDAIREQNLEKLHSIPQGVDIDELKLGEDYEHPLYFLQRLYEMDDLDEEFVNLAVSELLDRGMQGREKPMRGQPSPAAGVIAERVLPYDTTYMLMKKSFRDILEEGGDVKNFMREIVTEVGELYKDADFMEYQKDGPLVPFGTDTGSILNMLISVISHAEKSATDPDLKFLARHRKDTLEPLISFVENKHTDFEDRALEISRTKNEAKKNNGTSNLPVVFNGEKSDAKEKGNGKTGYDGKPMVQETEKETAKAVRADLNENFVGQQQAKDMMRAISARAVFDSIRHKDGAEDAPKEALHTRISGPTGVGKTTFAQYYNRMLTSIGRSNGKFVHLTREKVVATHIGQTENAMKEFLADAMGGVLFIDEVHNLTPEMGDGEKRDFGFRVVEALVAVMEEQRENITIVVAGYDEDIERFLSSDKGLRGRFDNALVLEPYGAEDLSKIMDHFAKINHVIIPEDVRDYAVEEIMKYKEAVGDQFANARVVRNFVEKMPTEMALRMMPDADDDAIAAVEAMSYEERNTVTKADAKAYISRMHATTEQKEVKRPIGFHAQF
ncbi:MAG: AAA family ATPase [Pseudomonadota bacterium]|nr:AAA family ATPase [Pseudomonadota bacterium]QKK05776.1 MAG: AAA family ATPase [Pseudomonadota bacterium]